MEVPEKKTAPDETLTLPESPKADQQPAPLPQGDRSRYVLLHEHARGGLGRVLLARDQALDRQVAVKISISDSPRAQARFAQEARITARLQHPGIVPVHDAGIWSNGQPYCAMKFIAGRSLRDLLRDLHDDFEARLALLPKIAAVAEALAYAHDQGIVHRDIKPSNIMVGDFGETVIVDWGIALELSQTQDEQASSVVGTRGYMAPEQERGEVVDARADVFALGVVLFETLGGCLPGDATGRLRTTEPRIPRELAAIVTKASAVEPAQRYADAGELGHDLRAYLDGQLVRAHQYSWLQRARRRIRRHRGALVSLLVVGLAAIALLAMHRAGNATPSCDVPDSEMAGIWDTTTRGRLETALADLSQPGGQEAFPRITRSLDHKRAQWMKMRRAVCEARYVRGTESEPVFVRRMECLDRRRGELAALTAHLIAPAPDTRPSRLVSAVLGLPSISVCADNASIQATSPPPEDPQLRQRVRELRAKLDDAHTLRTLAHDKEATAAVRALLKPIRELDYPPLTADLLLDYSHVLDDAADQEGARHALEEAALEAGRAGNPTLVAKIQASLLILVTDELREPKQAAAIQPLAAASAAMVPDDARTQAGWRQALGVVAWRKHDYETAISEYKTALTLVEGLEDPGPTDVASLLNDLGMSYRGNGEYDKAEQAYQRALKLFTDEFGPRHPNALFALNNLGILEESRAQYDKALAYYQKALSLKRAVLGENHPSVASSLSSIGIVYEKIGDPENGYRYLKQALDIRIKALGEDHPRVAADLDNLGTALLVKNDIAGAREMFQRSYDLHRKHTEANDIRLADPLNNLGLADRGLGNYDAAVRECREALDIRLRVLKPESHAVAQTRLCLARAQLESGRAHAAVKQLSLGLEAYEKTEHDPAELNRARFDLARAILESGGSRDKALELAHQARKAIVAADDSSELVGDIDAWLKKHGR